VSPGPLSEPTTEELLATTTNGKGRGMKTIALCAAYLAAIVAANLSIAHWGPQVAIYNGFLFIGLDLTTRDTLHDLWRGHLVRNMTVLIASGSILSYAISLATASTFPGGPSVGRIAAASFVAFALAATSDALAYHALRDRTWYERSNQSNLVSAAVDSVVFLPLAGFGFPWAVVFGLFCAKVAGGVVWSFVLGKGADGRSWLGRQKELYGVR
jgi:uncharacterized PurR-regulated membrane protein YhhQ (DUF165 family)